MLAGATFGLEALPSTAMIVGLGGAVLIGGFAAMLIWMAIGLKRVSFEVEADALRIRAPFYGRRVPRSALKLDEAKVLDGDAAAMLKQYGRKNGVGLPGYRVGWFRNRAGDKALLYLTDLDKVLSVPTTQGHTLYVSPENPAELLAALKGA